MDSMSVWVLTVLLMTANPPKVYKTEVFSTMDECIQWANFYNEYPFFPSCNEEKSKDKK